MKIQKSRGGRLGWISMLHGQGFGSALANSPVGSLACVSASCGSLPQGSPGREYFSDD